MRPLSLLTVFVLTLTPMRVSAAEDDFRSVLAEVPPGGRLLSLTGANDPLRSTGAPISRNQIPGSDSSHVSADCLRMPAETDLRLIWMETTDAGYDVTLRFFAPIQFLSTLYGHKVHHVVSLTFSSPDGETVTEAIGKSGNIGTDEALQAEYEDAKDRYERALDKVLERHLFGPKPRRGKASSCDAKKSGAATGIVTNLRRASLQPAANTPKWVAPLPGPYWNLEELGLEPVSFGRAGRDAFPFPTITNWIPDAWNLPPAEDGWAIHAWSSPAIQGMGAAPAAFTPYVAATLIAPIGEAGMATPVAVSPPAQAVLRSNSTRRRRCACRLPISPFDNRMPRSSALWQEIENGDGECEN